MSSKLIWLIWKTACECHYARPRLFKWIKATEGFICLPLFLAKAGIIIKSLSCINIKIKQTNYIALFTITTYATKRFAN